MYRPVLKTRVLFDNLSSTTTEDSLKSYLSTQKYHIESCAIVSGGDTNKSYAKVNFFTIEDVNELMENRPHRIDGKQVEVYRSIPDQGPFKTKKGTKNLIVSDVKNGLKESHLQTYFEKYGKITNIVMNNNDDSCRIEFDE